MPRKTHRVGKKKKNTTHKKRKYVIRKYKFLRGGFRRERLCENWYKQ